VFLPDLLAMIVAMMMKNQHTSTTAAELLKIYQIKKPINSQIYRMKH
jgi:hypothetical protein